MFCNFVAEGLSAQAAAMALVYLLLSTLGSSVCLEIHPSSVIPEDIALQHWLAQLSGVCMHACTYAQMW